MTALQHSPEFQYRNGRLHAEAVALDAIAQAVGTPVYCYSSAALRRTYTAYMDAFDGLDAQVCYAVKANGNLAIIRTFAALGAGADVVSEGEFRKALAAGVPASRIVFSGVGKTEAELEAALRAGVTQINVESEPELEMLSAVARRTGVGAQVSLRINPDVDARTHKKISTGRKENKFGIDLGRAIAAYARAEKLEGLAPDGLAVHIGSQLTEIEPFARAFRTVAYLVGTLRGAGHTVERLDLGGGLGIAYDDHPRAQPHRVRRSGAGDRWQSRLRPDLRAGTLAGRQCGDSPDPRDPGERRRQPPFRSGGCGDERPQAPGALRRSPRHRAGQRAGA